MKFHDLPLGARFELEGAVYVKSSPVLANKEGSGESRFMARYKVVTPLDGATVQPKAARGRMLKEAAVLAAFEGYHERCRHALEQVELPPAQMETVQGELAEARAAFLAALHD
ncbi:MAG: hypothetical protein AB7U30_11050 [Sulfuricellaceae bacterium]|jgi:hypothetical protein